ncbi:ASCH domain-containing protein [Alloacidobacterium dinghuense]|uniref:ASCH domain-containing protein n=1 Tax=Alloacidobacterium dinghuense TaxID=2763107 RepID=A0A7G8BPM5_9BACT|nr:ASCH domain-containing protein [Alloacidobacterium dinghuense]QNI34495.1 ASCH domain-containing protein [Alloacidobacterium dinghuense]
MAAFNFKQQFKPMILSGRKRHTIRAKRKRCTKPGERLYLFCGMRTKFCERLMEPVCTKVQDIVIDSTGSIFIDGERLHSDEREALAAADGFASYVDMMKFWNGRLPFEGDIIHWKFSGAQA